MSRSLLYAATSLLAAFPSTLAQNPLPARISINTGPPVAGITPGVVPGVAPIGTAVRPGTTFTVNVGAGGIGANATVPGGAIPQRSGAPGSQQVWVIRVGSTNGSLAFSPNTITGAQIGDQIQFQFYPMVS
jgi:hypothetical protein